VRILGGGFTGPGNIWVDRLAIPGMSSPTYGSLLVLPILIGAYFWKDGQGAVMLVYGGLTVFLFLCLFLTYSRGAIAALTAGVFYLLYKKFFTRREMIRIGAIVAFMAILFFDSFVTETMKYSARFQGLGLGDLIEEPRVIAALSSLELWASCPIVGCGYTQTYQTQVDLSDHNYYTTIMATRGLAGFIPFVIFLMMLFLSVSSAKYHIDRSEKYMKHILSAGMVAIIVNLAAYVPADFFHTWIWFGLVAAWINIAKGMKVGGVDERRVNAGLGVGWSAPRTSSG